MFLHRKGYHVGVLQKPFYRVHHRPVAPRPPLQRRWLALNPQLPAQTTTSHQRLVHPHLIQPPQWHVNRISPLHPRHVAPGEITRIHRILQQSVVPFINPPQRLRKIRVVPVFLYHRMQVRRIEPRLFPPHLHQVGFQRNQVIGKLPNPRLYRRNRIHETFTQPHCAGLTIHRPIPNPGIRPAIVPPQQPEQQIRIMTRQQSVGLTPHRLKRIVTGQLQHVQVVQDRLDRIGHRQLGPPGIARHHLLPNRIGRHLVSLNVRLHVAQKTQMLLVRVNQGLEKLVHPRPVRPRRFRVLNPIPDELRHALPPLILQRLARPHRRPAPRSPRVAQVHQLTLQGGFPVQIELVIYRVPGFVEISPGIRNLPYPNQNRRRIVITPSPPAHTPQPNWKPQTPLQVPHDFIHLLGIALHSTWNNPRRNQPRSRRRNLIDFTRHLVDRRPLLRLNLPHPVPPALRQVGIRKFLQPGQQILILRIGIQPVGNPLIHLRNPVPLRLQRRQSL